MHSNGAQSSVRPRKRPFPMWTVLEAGYSTFGREFAYLGVPPLFIGEAYLGYAILRNQRNWVGRFINGFLQFRPLALAIAAHMLWGIIEVVRGCMLNRSLLDSIRTAAFNYYPLYMLIGIVIGGTLNFPYFIRLLKWQIVVFGIRAAFLMCKIEIGLPANSALIAVWMIAAWDVLKSWKWRWPLLAGAMVPIFFAGTHGRGTFLGLVAGAVSVIVSSPKKMLEWSVYGTACLALLLVVGPLVPGPQGGGPPLDPVVQIARIIASDHPDFAMKLIKLRAGKVMIGPYRDEIDNIQAARGTASWRQDIWRNAIHSLRTPTLKIMGEGEGTSIVDLTPDGNDIHTPHNISIYCIYYTGYTGLAIFFMLLFVIWLLGTRLQNPTLRTLYLGTFWCTLLVAVTGNLLEAPFGAIPFYLWEGVLIGLDQKLGAEALYARRVRSERARQAASLADHGHAEEFVPAHTHSNSI